jgi:hypothetical protein
MHMVSLFQQQSYGAAAAKFGIVGVGRENKDSLVVDVHEVLLI